MEIELTKEQIDLIANEVINRGGAKLRHEPTRVNKNGFGKRRPIVMLGIGVPAKERRPVVGRDINLMLTVRSDLNAIVNAMSAGNGKHARRLAEELLVHVDETLGEL